MCILNSSSSESGPHRRPTRPSSCPPRLATFPVQPLWRFLARGRAPLAPFEPAADDRLHQHVVCPAGYAHADSKIDLPLRRNVQVECRNELLRLARERIEFSDRPQTTAVFQAEGHSVGEGPGDLRVRSELPSPFGFGPGVGFLERRVESPIQPALLLVHDGKKIKRKKV